MGHKNATPNATQNANGFSLVEILVVTGIMGIMMLAMVTLQTNQSKANAYLEFQLKRTQMHGTLVGQVLKDPNNCACLFAGSNAFPAAGIATLTGAAPTQIGLYTSAAPGCGAPLQFFIDGTGIDGLKATSINLQYLTPTLDPNTYSGQFTLNIRSTKDVLGPKDLSISIPVTIATTPAGANRNFVSCSNAAGPASARGFVYKTYCGATTGNINFSSCAPPACSPGDSDLGLNSHGTGIISGWQNYYTERSCTVGAPPSQMIYETGCHFMGATGGNGWLPSTSLKCVPPVCRVGDVTVGTPTCFPLGLTGAGWLAGTCKRSCLVP